MDFMDMTAEELRKFLIDVEHFYENELRDPVYIVARLRILTSNEDAPYDESRAQALARDISVM